MLGLVHPLAWDGAKGVLNEVVDDSALEVCEVSFDVELDLIAPFRSLLDSVTHYLVQLFDNLGMVVMIIELKVVVW